MKPCRTVASTSGLCPPFRFGPPSEFGPRVRFTLPPWLDSPRRFEQSLSFALVVAMLVGLASVGAAATIEDHVRELADDSYEGRLTGQKGGEEAARYIEKSLKELGVQPLPGWDSLLQPFEFTAGSKDAGTELRFTDASGKTHEVTGSDKVQALSFSEAGVTEGEVVFAGYGLKLPDESEFPYNSYATLDVKDKIVLVLRYFPEDVDQDTRALLARYSGLRYKAMQAREAGAKALLVVTGPNSPNAGEVVPMKFDTALSGSGIHAASVNLATAEQLLSASGKSVEEVQTSMDTGNPHVAGFAIEGTTVRLDVAIERERKTGHNVVGYLPPTVSSPKSGSIALGAHYDHLGHGEGGNSLAGNDEDGEIHNGADDNASGVALVLDVAARLVHADRDRGVVFGFWGGEELGLLGSSAFVDELDAIKPSIGAYLNFDMVGRLTEDKLNVQAVGSSDAWPGLLERANIVHGFDLHTQEDPYLPTDSQEFYLENVPTLNFFTGSHEDYHRPTDDVEKLNLDGLVRITDMAQFVTQRLLAEDSLPAWKEVERSREATGGRGSIRAFTGTIPDYTTEIKGLLLSGVVGGGPAEQAGLQKGDVIVEFGGQSITNIYDYTYALEAVKVDVPLQVVFLRGEEKMEVTMTPTSRN